MRIREILIKLITEEKIYKKHGIHRAEINNALLEGNPIFFRTRDNKYVAIARKERYITIIFHYKREIADISTAYQSSDWQIKLYKGKRLEK